ncbi:GyrI-like domain-containing protein, partial [Enterococcus faecium]|nr:GyrI-like domain-containing protein [Enterococcus faecium]ELT8942726.1 GyrI-like domain-containing protein [Enterococcus faecium]EME7194979.1 GyrI-like domain-containing protein [Enterococcus faecium]EME8079753.1 GyrI-like domain-containing protein [Enterococcus faecium]
ITNEANKLNYMASYDIRKSEIDKKMNLDFMEIEETEYAIIKLKGKVPECIQEGWKYAMEVFFPQEGYRHSGKPDLEVYFEGDMKKENYSMELWIPVEKEN